MASSFLRDQSLCPPLIGLDRTTIHADARKDVRAVEHVVIQGTIVSSLDTVAAHRASFHQCVVVPAEYNTYHPDMVHRAHCRIVCMPPRSQFPIIAHSSI